jgi:hypothetical protein
LPKWAACYADRPCQTIGLRAAALLGIDRDADHPVVAEIVYRNALFYLGHTPKRGRPNSRKYLLMYRLKPGGPPITKKRLTFDDPWGQSYALELLAKGGIRPNSWPIPLPGRGVLADGDGGMRSSEPTILGPFCSRAWLLVSRILRLNVH